MYGFGHGAPSQMKTQNTSGTASHLKCAYSHSLGGGGGPGPDTDHGALVCPPALLWFTPRRLRLGVGGMQKQYVTLSNWF